MNPFTKTIIVFLAFIFSCFSLSGQNYYREYFENISPLPGAELVSLAQTISVSLQKEFSVGSVENLKFSLAGSTSGKIPGEIFLLEDSRSIHFKPHNAFSRGEEIEVDISFLSNNKKVSYSWTFTTGRNPSDFQKQILNQLPHLEKSFSHPKITALKGDFDDLKVKNDSLPAGFPEISITDWEDPSEGYFFMAPYANKKLSQLYMIITDNFATPVYFSNIADGIAADFKLQPDNKLSFYRRAEWEFNLMNSDFEIVDTISAGNGYIADLHELIILENGHAFLMAYDPQVVDMSQVVEGGKEDAVVIGLIIQELDESKNVVFQWRSWDHFEITDAADWVSLISESIDYVHGNAIEVDSDTSLMISCRNMDEVTKIDRRTGDIIWRLGGKKNMFNFPQADRFCHQHDIRLMPANGNISVFDNGNCHSPQYSSAAEYELDLTNMSVELIQRMRASPDIYGAQLGNAQRMDNNNTLVGWGSGIPSITEFDPDGNVLLQFSFQNQNYRAFKFDWQTTAMLLDTETIDFGLIDLDDSLSANVQITNTTTNEISINRILNHEEEIFTVQQSLPVNIGAGETSGFEIKFKPTSTGTFNDKITFCWDHYSDTLIQRIARQVDVTGSADVDVFIDNNLEKEKITIYPNPVSDFITISATNEIKTVRLINSSGAQIQEDHFPNLRNFKVSLDIPDGLYFLVIISNDNTISYRKIVKQ